MSLTCPNCGGEMVIVTTSPAYTVYACKNGCQCYGAMDNSTGDLLGSREQVQEVQVSC